MFANIKHESGFNPSSRHFDQPRFRGTEAENAHGLFQTGELVELVQHLARLEGHDAIQDAIDFLTDALLSHLAYEEQELVEPLARLGFYPGQVPDGAAAAI